MTALPVASFKHCVVKYSFIFFVKVPSQIATTALSVIFIENSPNHPSWYRTCAMISFYVLAHICISQLAEQWPNTESLNLNTTILTPQSCYYGDLTLFLASHSLNPKILQIETRGEFLTLLC